MKIYDILKINENIVVIPGQLLLLACGRGSVSGNTIEILSHAASHLLSQRFYRSRCDSKWNAVCEEKTTVFPKTAQTPKPLDTTGRE